MIRFFLSLRTISWLFTLFIGLCLIGSIVLPKNLEFFSGIDDTPLFNWLFSVGRPSLTWWIYGMIFLLLITAISTIFCTIDGIKRLSRGLLVRRLSIEVMHIGVLFVMLGHLLTAYSGERIDISIKKAEGARLLGENIFIKEIKTFTDEEGYPIYWEVRLKDSILRPSRPIRTERGLIYLKSVSEDSLVVIGGVHDPGAIWALIGGILLSIGSLGVLRLRR